MEGKRPCFSFRFCCLLYFYYKAGDILAGSFCKTLIFQFYFQSKDEIETLGKLYVVEDQFDNLHTLAGKNYKIHVAMKTFSFGFWLFN